MISESIRRRMPLPVNGMSADNICTLASMTHMIDIAPLLSAEREILEAEFLFETTWELTLGLVSVVEDSAQNVKKLIRDHWQRNGAAEEKVLQVSGWDRTQLRLQR